MDLMPIDTVLKVVLTSDVAAQPREVRQQTQETASNTVLPRTDELREGERPLLLGVASAEAFRQRAAEQKVDKTM
jgi:hypothetical protein